LIAFQYDSPTAHYVFHLPFRVAEEFLSESHRRKLLESSGTSRECAVFYGRTIIEAESQEHPIENILSELQVDVAAICPSRLIEKRERLLHLSPYWNSIEEDEDEDGEYWEDKWWDDLEWHELLKFRNRERKNKQTQLFTHPGETPHSVLGSSFSTSMILARRQNCA
jgi:hypothetical protein